MKKLETPKNKKWASIGLAIAIILLIIANIHLIKKENISPWQFDHMLWVPEFITSVLSFAIAWCLQKIEFRILIVLIAILMCLELENYYPVLISIGILVGFFCERIYYYEFGQFMKAQENIHK